MEQVHTETDANGIEYRVYVEQDDTAVRGNALASGDDAEDKAAEDEIMARLEGGDVWAWAAVRVEARKGGVIGVDCLGCCSYANTADFVAPGGYYDDMKDEARSDLMTQLKDAAEAYGELNG